MKHVLNHVYIIHKLLCIYVCTVQVMSVGTLDANTSEQSPTPPSPRAMLSFDDRTHNYTKKSYLPTFVNIVFGGQGVGDCAQIVA